MNNPNLYKYCEQCRVKDKYPKLCYANYTDEQRKLYFGGSCPIADEDKSLEELIMGESKKKDLGDISNGK